MIKINKTKAQDSFAKCIFVLCACLSVVAVFGIIGYILYASVPALREIGAFNFLFGKIWAHQLEDRGWALKDIYGILPMFFSSVVVTLSSVVLGGFVGVFTAVFLAFWCPDKFYLKYSGNNKIIRKSVEIFNKINLKTVFDQVIKLLAGIPSVVYGYFGLKIIVAGLAFVDPNGRGYGVLATTLVLAIMLVPTVTSLTKNALESVPGNYYEGALAMGNTKAQAVFNVVFPAARSGVVSALILGIGRAVGETMAVLMVSGGSVNFPSELFIPIRTLTTNIMLEMGEAAVGSIHESALIATGLVLLVLVLFINLSINFIPKNFREKKGTRRLRGNSDGVFKYRKKGVVPEILKYVSVFCAFVVVAALVAVISFILVNGIPHIGWNFLFGGDSYEGASLLPAFITTGYVIFFTLIIALPLGVGAAVYFVEYAKPGSKFVKILRTFTDTLAGVPSIVFGLFGYLLFVSLFGRSVYAGAFTLVLVVLPTIIRSTEESLYAVPMAWREASYGLGAGKVRTIFKVVLPAAFPGIATATVLSVGRILSESAALVYTSGMVSVGTSFVATAANPANPASTLTVFMYSFFAEGLAYDEAYATAVVLLVFTFALNLIVYFIERCVKRKKQ